MRLAIVHDYLNLMGGAERVVEAFHELYPEAPIYTSFYNSSKMPTVFRNMDIRTSFMQKLPLIKKHFKKYLLLYPFAFEQFDLRGYDVVLSSSSAWAKGIITRPETCHICYCHSPVRFAWSSSQDYIKQSNINPVLKLILPFALSWIRLWDYASAQRVDYYIASCKNVAKRINKYYGRDYHIIYPPIDTSVYIPTKKNGTYFLLVSRLAHPYKRVDIAIQAFNKLGYDLKVIGDGSDYKFFRRMAKPNIEFLGHMEGSLIGKHYAECKALIFPSEDDFGMVPLEAQASGRPVIAYGKGGALETVINGETGLFFSEQTSQALIEAVYRFEKMEFDKERIRKHVLKFDKEIFKEKIRKFVEEKYLEHKEGFNIQNHCIW